MKQYKIDFIELLVEAEALKFGEFTLKSGRVAPYFLSAGSFYTGELLSKLGRAYAEAFIEAGVDVDIIFGPAYKGIPLSVITTGVLYLEFERNVKYGFNRKEQKNYADGGVLVGAPLNSDSRVMLIDDVITAGTAIREVVDVLRQNGNPKIEAVLIMLDRMEKNNDGVNAVKAVEEDFGLKVFSIVTLDDVVEALYNREVGGKIYIDEEMINKINSYRREYGI